MVPDGEEAKTAEVAASCWEALGEEGFTRSDVVVTLGGGATTDLGGFVAASWLRGVRVVHVPTTLLAMVDAAVGGKTGINTAAGKNLVGAFHEPAGVLCDLALLETLPRAELVAGLGEVVKCGFIADPEILAAGRGDRPATRSCRRPPVLRELVERAIRVKIDVVVGRPQGDRRQRRRHPGREALNYGHTLAHAIERAEGYTHPARRGRRDRLRVRRRAGPPRGGAVAAEVVERHRTAFGRVGLPTTYDGAPVRRPARHDAGRQEGPRRPAPVRRARRRRPADDPHRPVRGRPARRLRGDRRPRVTRVLVLNGPNLGRLGRRQPEIYGTTTHAELAHLCVEWGAALGLEVEVRQTNHEGELLDWLNAAADDGTPVVLNAAAWTALLLRALRRLRPAHRPAGGGAHLGPVAAARGVPPHLGGHDARRPRGRRPGHRGLPDRPRDDRRGHRWCRSGRAAPRAGDDLQPVAVRALPVEAAAAVLVVDLAGLPPVRVGPPRPAAVAQPARRSRRSRRSPTRNA